MSACAAAAEAYTRPGRRRHAITRWGAPGDRMASEAADDDHEAADRGSGREAGSGHSGRRLGGGWGAARRRPVRSGFARISESLVDVPLAPQPLFEVALK